MQGNAGGVAEENGIKQFNLPQGRAIGGLQWLLLGQVPVLQGIVSVFFKFLFIRFIYAKSVPEPVCYQNKPKAAIQSQLKSIVLLFVHAIRNDSYLLTDR